MLIAQGLGGRTAVIATEGGRAQFHINDYGCENMTVYPLSAYTTSAYIALIQQLEKQYDNFLIEIVPLMKMTNTDVWTISVHVKKLV